MTNIKPITIQGRWRKGFVLDYHTVGSTFLGSDEYGHPIFDTKRTELGELLYRLKYRSDTSVITEIIQAATDFISRWNPEIDCIVPVLPSRSGRPLQPVMVLAEEISAKLNLPVTKNCIIKVKETPELKNIFDYDERLHLLEDVHRVESPLIAGKKVLLFDDLYRSGATMNAIASALYDQGNVADIFALAITRTRSKS
ncbi:MAG: ComF family protein [Candidatus Latescibacterota bacterium]